MDSGAAVMKMEPAAEAEAEGCAVCGGTEELRAVDEHQPPPGLPPLRAMLLHLAHNKGSWGTRVCEACAGRAADAYQFSASLGRSAPLSDKIRALRRRLHDLTQKIDVFIVVGGGQEGGTYSEEDIIMVDRAALAAAAAADDDELERAHNARGDHVYQCTVCPQSFQRVSEFRLHVAEHPAGARHSCWTCGIQADTRRELLNHQQDAHGPVSECRLCHTTFQSQRALRAHAAGCGAGGGARCPARGCGWRGAGRGAGRGALAAHAAEQHGPGAAPPHVCAVCFHQFDQSSELRAHALRHRLSRAFVCAHDGCILRFAARPALLAHIRAAHGGGPAAPPGDTGESTVPCPHCYRTFGSMAAMRRHARVHRGESHPAGAEPEQTGQPGQTPAEDGVEYLEVEALEEMELEYKPDLTQL